jgi:anti-sigma B factor antagonist
VGQDSAQTEEFAIVRRAVGPGRTRITVRGELDLSHAAELKSLLARELAAGTTVLLDLSAVDFIDSTGLAAIVTAMNHSGGSGCGLQLYPELRPQARRLMELTGVLRLLSLVDCNGDGSASSR